jgi:hypothetical protein
MRLEPERSLNESAGKAPLIDAPRFNTSVSEDGFSYQTTCDVKLGHEKDISHKIYKAVSRQTVGIKHATLQGDPDMMSFYNLDINLGALPLHVYELVLNSLDNLAENQIDDGKIDVSVSLEGSRLSVGIFDNGTGIPETEVENIFHTRIKSTKGEDAVFGGAGLGLYQVNKWANEHGGDVTYERVEGGSKFVISVDTHAHEYPVDEIGVSTSSHAAQRQITHYYADQIQARYTSLSAKADLTFDEEQSLFDLQTWLSDYDPNKEYSLTRTLTAQSLLYPPEVSIVEEAKEIDYTDASHTDVPPAFHNEWPHDQQPIGGLMTIEYAFGSEEAYYEKFPQNKGLVATIEPKLDIRTELEVEEALAHADVVRVADQPANETEIFDWYGLGDAEQPVLEADESGAFTFGGEDVDDQSGRAEEYTQWQDFDPGQDGDASHETEVIFVTEAGLSPVFGNDRTNEQSWDRDDRDEERE